MVLAEDSLSSSDEESDIAEDPDFPLPDVEDYSEPVAGMVVDQGQIPESESDLDVTSGMTSDSEMDIETDSNSEQQHSLPEGKTKQMKLHTYIHLWAASLQSLLLRQKYRNIWKR